MNVWRDLSIRSKIVSAFAAVLLVLAAVGVLAIVELARINHKAAEIRDNWLPSIVRLNKLEGALRNVRAKQAHQLINHSVGAEAVRTFEPIVADAVGKVERAYEEFEPFIDPGSEEERLMAVFAELWPKYRASVLHTLDLAHNGDLTGAKAVFGGADLETSKAILDVLLKNVAYNEAQAKAAADAAEATFVLSRATLAGGLAAAGLLGALCCLALIVGLVRPIGLTAAAIEKLAEGDLSVAVSGVERGDEIGLLVRALDVFKRNMIRNRELERQAAAEREQRARQQEEVSAREAELMQVAEEERQRSRAEALDAERVLVVGSIGSGLERLAEKDMTVRLTEPLPAAYARLQDNFNAAVAQLADAFGEVSACAEAVRGSGGEIVSASDDLSRRTAQQASSLEETAAALEEITATVNRTAEGAQAARDAVVIAQGDASRGGDIVRQAVDAMGRIEKSSREIGEIIGVIDEIAFQTNLLALNAGVEAARAGEAGRGFAVVASEVRALAQRSAESAKQIKGLISTSSAEVDEGVSLVAETGRALEQIERKVGEITVVVTAIAKSAQEQAVGMRQIGAAVAQIDQVTQQNAAMSEQATAAGAALAEESDRLTGLIARFQIEREAEAPRASRTSARRVGKQSAA